MVFGSFGIELTLRYIRAVIEVRVIYRLVVAERASTFQNTFHEALPVLQRLHCFIEMHVGAIRHIEPRHNVGVRTGLLRPHFLSFRRHHVVDRQWWQVDYCVYVSRHEGIQP